ncbi:hypothetical protein ACFO4E_24025 [Nocardiopsis mangrovi]|uniref:Uncharacterized protein n=1 Tax=Nocardiopsis mangrovi TaxID=1179818 RepID=A0ABV9E304_9ACTN
MSTGATAAGTDAGTDATGPFGSLREQLRGAATAFAGGPGAVPGILSGMVDDVDRALREELEIFPVCHHSPASALAMARRLREKRPKVVYMELCEDLAPLLDELRNCRLPVALQAYAGDLDGFPDGAGPLSVIAPITETSAEYQAIAYALETPGVELVLVDRSVDHLFQWELPAPDGSAPDASDPGASGAGAPAASAAPGEATAHEESAGLHGDAVGVELGELRPRFAELEEHLLHHGKVRHWSEWWDQYVEQPLAGAGYDTYRQVMVLIGSLFRRLAPSDGDRLSRDEDRERYMWTRIRAHLARTGGDPAECMYVCGAFHAASRVEEFGLAAPETGWEIGPATATEWLYGLIPSSHSAIEAQFGLAGGSVSISAATWEKQVSAGGAVPFRLKGQRTGKGGAGTGKAKGAGRARAAAAPAGVTDRLSEFLSSPPAAGDLDESELLGWCVDIVRLARRNGYTSSTADAIAVFETSILLAGIRGRARPTPYDFQDAAITCIEKDTVPGRRDVRHLCEILLGGDRIGEVGYSAMPPLARDVFDRLAPLGIGPSKRTVRRVLLDLKADPELEPCSRLLWRLSRLLRGGAVRPITGSLELGERSTQESWDVSLGRDQRPLIELGYEGVTVEQVLEQRLRRSAWEPKATAATALAAIEDAICYLDNPRFTDELGARAVELLAAERTVDDAPEVLRRFRRLLAYYRAGNSALPRWCESFVTAGYAHYCTLLPGSFTDEHTGVRQVAAMLGFLFTLENMALSLGCDRTQLELAVKQSHPEAPAKVALLWAAQAQLGVVTRDRLRARCAELLDNPLVVPAFPQYLSGFVQALSPAPSLAPFVVEVMSDAFARLPDQVLLPWLPTLITTLREHAQEMVPVLIREAGRTFPASLPAVDAWVPPWAAEPEPVRPAAPAAPAGPVADLLAGNPAACDAVAALLGCDGGWPAAGEPGGAAAGPSAHREAAGLLARHPAAAAAAAELVAGAGARA